MQLSSAALQVYSSNFSKNTAEKQGGCISAGQSAMNFTGSNFDSNQASQGGVLITLSGVLNVSSCRFTSNRASLQSQGGQLN